MRQRRLRASLGVLVVGLLASSCGGTTTATSSSPALTPEGRLQVSIEALLRETFGSTPVCATGTTGGDLNFVSTPCSPLSTYSPFAYIFGPGSYRTLSLSTRKPAFFENYPEAIEVKGRTDGDL
jgi:hypothetical protein